MRLITIFLPFMSRLCDRIKDQNSCFSSILSFLKKRIKFFRVVGILGIFLGRKIKCWGAWRKSRKNYSLDVLLIFFHRQWELSLKFQNILYQEKDYWAIRSNYNWLNLGDRNTAFFHQMVQHRKRINHISIVKNEDNEWVSEPKSI